MIELNTSLNIIKCFTYYIYNKLNAEEFYILFGSFLAAHIYDKFVNSPDKLDWFANLDENCQKVILERALELYDK